MSEPEINPYAAPQTTNEGAHRRGLSAEELPEICVDGDCLVVAPWVTLPKRCIVTNEPVDRTNRSQSFSWAPSMRMTLVTRPGRIRFSVNPKRLRRQRKIRLMIAGATVVITLVSLALGDGFAAALIFGFGVLVTLFFPSDELSVKKFERNRFWLTGFSRAFLWSCRDEFGLLQEHQEIRERHRGTRTL